MKTYETLLGIAIVFVFLAVLLLLLSSVIALVENNLALDKCERENNVYQCELIAVPVEGE